MGAVSIDIYRNEREYKDFSFSDYNVVKYLVLYRHTLDIGYSANVNVNINEAGDIFEFNSELIAIFASLDKLIEKIVWKKREKEFLDLIFEGNTVSDIYNHYDFPPKTAYRTFNRIIRRIVKANNEQWKECLVIQKYIT